MAAQRPRSTGRFERLTTKAPGSAGGYLLSRTMRDAFSGFDSAWAGKVPGGIVWATFEDQHLAAFAEPRLAGFNDAAQIIDTLRSECDYVLVAVDQPTVVPNETGSRPVDGVARGLISKLGSGVQPANRSKQAMFGSNAPIWRFLERLGASERRCCMNTRCG